MYFFSIFFFEQNGSAFRAASIWALIFGPKFQKKVFKKTCFKVTQIIRCNALRTRSWDYCSSMGDESRFNVDVALTSKAISTGSNEYLPPQQFYFNDLLTADQVCSPKAPSSWNVSKCLREFWFLWTNILFELLMIMLFMPILIVLSKWMVHKIHKNKNYKHLSIDSEYIMITTKLEICIIFGLVCPLIIPLAVFALKWNEIFYALMIKKFNLLWPIKFSNNNNIPVIYLYFSLLVQHLFSFLFIFYYRYQTEAHHGKVASILFLAALAISYCFISLCKTGKLKCRKCTYSKC